MWRLTRMNTARLRVRLTQDSDSPVTSKLTTVHKHTCTDHWLLTAHTHTYARTHARTHASTHISIIRKKLTKQQYVLQMSSQYGELQPTKRWDRLASLRHPSKFQPVWRLGFVTARTLLYSARTHARTRTYTHTHIHTHQQRHSGSVVYWPSVDVLLSLA